MVPLVVYEKLKTVPHGRIETKGNKIFSNIVEEKVKENDRIQQFASSLLRINNVCSSHSVALLNLWHTHVAWLYFIFVVLVFIFIEISKDIFTPFTQIIVSFCPLSKQFCATLFYSWSVVQRGVSWQRGNRERK